MFIIISVSLSLFIDLSKRAINTSEILLCDDGLVMANISSPIYRSQRVAYC